MRRFDFDAVILLHTEGKKPFRGKRNFYGCWDGRRFGQGREGGQWAKGDGTNNLGRSRTKSAHKETHSTARSGPCLPALLGPWAQRVGMLCLLLLLLFCETTCARPAKRAAMEVSNFRAHWTMAKDWKPKIVWRHWPVMALRVGERNKGKKIFAQQDAKFAWHSAVF